jgi:hypothetical protein
MREGYAAVALFFAAANVGEHADNGGEQLGEER